MCSRECFVAAFISAHVGVCPVMGSDMRFQVVSSGKALATPFMSTLSNESPIASIQGKILILTFSTSLVDLIE